MLNQIKSLVPLQSFTPTNGVTPPSVRVVMKCGVSGIPLPVIEWRRRDGANNNNNPGNDNPGNGAGTENDAGSDDGVVAEVAPAPPSAQWLADCWRKSRAGEAPCAPVPINAREDILGGELGVIMHPVMFR